LSPRNRRNDSGVTIHGPGGNIDSSAWALGGIVHSICTFVDNDRLCVLNRMSRNRCDSPDSTFLLVLKKQGREVGEIVSPYHPRVHARGFDSDHWKIFGFKPCRQFTIRFEVVIFRTACNPEQVQCGPLPGQGCEPIIRSKMFRR
jgi:hypothetical protein